MHDATSKPEQAQVTKCQRWSGAPEWYQAEARSRLGVTVHLWVVPTCDTELCVRVEHLDAHRPEALDYPDRICVYCGLMADTVDHLLPRTWTGDSARRRVLTVPACRQCNSILGDRYAPAINERREIVHETLFRRYRNKLGVADNLDEMLVDMGPTLKSAVLAQVQFGDLIRDRLSWPGTDGYDLGACVRSGIADPYSAGLLTRAEAVLYVDEEYVSSTKRDGLGVDVPRQRSRHDRQGWPIAVDPVGAVSADRPGNEGRTTRRGLDSSPAAAVAGHVRPVVERARQAWPCRLPELRCVALALAGPGGATPSELSVPEVPHRRSTPAPPLTLRRWRELVATNQDQVVCDRKEEPRRGWHRPGDGPTKGRSTMNEVTCVRGAT